MMRNIERFYPDKTDHTETVWRFLGKDITPRMVRSRGQKAGGSRKASSFLRRLDRGEIKLKPE